MITDPADGHYLRSFYFRPFLSLGKSPHRSCDQCICYFDTDFPINEPINGSSEHVRLISRGPKWSQALAGREQCASAPQSRGLRIGLQHRVGAVLRATRPSINRAVRGWREVAKHHRVRHSSSRGPGDTLRVAPLRPVARGLFRPWAIPRRLAQL